MSAERSLSVIMPAYNEIHTIGEILVRVTRVLPEVPKEIVVVDDCSSDGTREWLERNIPAAGMACSGLFLDEAGELVYRPLGDGTAAATSIVLVLHEVNHRGQLTVLMRQAGLRATGAMGPAQEDWARMGREPPLA